MENKKLNKIGFWSIVLLGINGILGSGVFLLPGQIMDVVGDWSSIVYIFAFLLVLSIAWCFAQCAALFTCNGGAYIYAKEAFGEGVVAFEMGVVRYALGIVAWAALAVAFVTALSSIWPLALVEPIRTILIISLVGSLSYMNYFGVKIFKHLNNIVTVTKVVPLILFVGIGAFYIQETNFSPLTMETFHLDTFGTAALIVFYAFGGFEMLVVAAGEMENPRKNLPLALMLSIGVCSCLYLCMQLVAMGILGQDLQSSISPISDSAAVIFGTTGKWIATLSMLISIGGINIAASFVCPINGVILAEDGIFPKWFAKKSKLNTPIFAIIVTAILTLILAFSANFTTLAVISVVTRFAQYICICFATIALYRQGRIPKTTSKLMIYTVPLIAVSGMSWLLCYATKQQLIGGLSALVIALPFYWLRHKKNHSIGSEL